MQVVQVICLSYLVRRKGERTEFSSPAGATDLSPGPKISEFYSVGPESILKVLHKGVSSTTDIVTHFLSEAPSPGCQGPCVHLCSLLC